jgi:hypothetical protein
VPDPAQLRPALSKPVCSLVRRCLPNDRVRRFADAAELAAALDAVSAGGAPRRGRTRAVGGRAVAGRPPALEPDATGDAGKNDERAERAKLALARSSHTGSIAAIVALSVAVLVIGALVIREFAREPVYSTSASGPAPVTRAPANRGTPSRPAQGGSSPTGRAGAPAPTTRPPAATPSNEELGRLMYRQAQLLMQRSGSRVWAAIPALLDARDRARDSSFHDKIDAFVKQAEAVRDEKARSTLRALDARARRLAQSQQYGDAISQYNTFPGMLQTGPWKERVAAKRSEMELAAARAYTKAELQARMIAESGDYDAAMKHLDAVAAWGVPQLNRAARAQKAAFVAQKERRAPLLAAVRRERRVAGVRKVLVPLRKRDFDDARRIATGLADEAEDPTDAAMFRNLAADVTRIKQLWDRADAELKTKLPGFRLRLETIPHELISYKRGRIRAKMAGLETPKTVVFREMRRENMLRLLDRYVQFHRKDPAVHIAVGLTYLLDRTPSLDRAEKWFRSAGALGGDADSARCLGYLELIRDVDRPDGSP